ncbi:MAG: hypothetical protein LAT68_16175 [Cyclobacteriaceae bacterium]|nr:hypothetical protein [Cyclobacteriaceae bacterium]
MDQHLSDGAFSDPSFTSMRSLTDKERSANSLSLPVDSGVRVSFNSNVGAILSYDNPPRDGSKGTVVTVRSSSLGDITSHEGMVFVKWDDGKFGAFDPVHLRRDSQKTSSSSTMRVSCLGDLSDFMKSGSDLVHKATKDLWSLKKDGDDYVIERLFDDSGEPLKV